MPDGPVVVWGAGEGIELALDLAQQGRQVRLLDPGEKLVPAAYIGSRTGCLLRWAARPVWRAEQDVELVKVSPPAR